jgi:hypothetical protein
MASPQHPVDHDDEHLLVHQYIRLFGRRPSPKELADYRSAVTRVRYRMRPRVRRRIATIVARL